MRSVQLACALAAFLSLGPAAWGQNLVLNPSLDADAISWAPETFASVDWSSFDSENDPMSGSALVTNLHPNANNGQGMVQCLPAIVIPGATYRFGGKVFVPSGQANTGYAQVGLRWYDDLNCTGSVVGSQPRVSTATIDSWVPLLATGEIAPSGAWSVLFLAFPTKIESGGSYLAYFDALFLEREMPFVDGFELGDAAGWSSMVPAVITAVPWADGSQLDHISRVFCQSGDCPWSPPTQLHDGIDLHPVGDLAPFQAVCSGEVEAIDLFLNTGNGKYQVNVTVRYAHDSNHLVYYAFEPFSSDPAVGNLQLANIVVNVGTVVAPGDLIGYLVRDDPQAAHVHWGFAVSRGQICVAPYLSDTVRDVLLDRIRTDHPSWNLCH